MSNGNHVRPGEVISSSLINQILDRLDSLEKNAAGPGPAPGTGTGAIVIDGFEPPAQQEVGRVLAILGSNLPFPADGNTVTIGSVLVPAANLRLAPSNRERLEFVVPNIGSLPQGGQNLFVRVSMGSSSAQRLYQILPASGGPPTPTITSVRAVGDTSGAPIAMGAIAVIAGSSFSSNPTSNTITFTPLGGTPVAEPYPRPGDPPLTIESTATSEIRVVVPDMSEITVAVGARRVRVDVSVAGAPDPGTFEFFAFRT